MKKKTLEITHPHLLKEWDYAKNSLRPIEVVAGSNKKVFWKCSKNHEWLVSPNQRTYYSTGCPYCSNQKVCKDNCLATTHPQFLEFWDYIKNKLKPTEIAAGSSRKVWWKCSNGHSFQIETRYFSDNFKCKICNSVFFSFLEKEWNYKKNKINPKDILSLSARKVWWKCEKGHEWKAIVCNRKNGSSCPFCCGKKVCKDNCLATTHSHLLKHWNYKKNKIKPEEVTFGSHKKVWWQCEKNHEWKASVCERANDKGCPYCSNQKVCKDNCLSTTHPKLSKEWSSKNKIKPTEITYGSTIKIWWKCKHRHRWQASPNSRTKNNCPICNESKGEKLVSQVLDSLQVRHKREYKIKKLNKYKFDFALFEKYKRKPYAAIEYHGEQHYLPVRFGGVSLAKAKENLVSCQKRDLIKKQYCLDNNIKYLEISYKDKENIEQIIREFIK